MGFRCGSTALLAATLCTAIVASIPQPVSSGSGDEGIRASVMHLKATVARGRADYEKAPDKYSAEELAFLLYEELQVAGLEGFLWNEGGVEADKAKKEIASREFSLKLQIMAVSPTARERVFSMAPASCVGSTNYGCMERFIADLSSTVFRP